MYRVSKTTLGRQALAICLFLLNIFILILAFWVVPMIIIPAIIISLLLHKFCIDFLMPGIKRK